MTFLEPIAWSAPLAGYEAQAEALWRACLGGESGALQHLRAHHPRFLEAGSRWKPLDVDDAEVAAAALTRDDARLVVARSQGFRDWEALAAHAAAVVDPASPAHRFERAAEAVVAGDLEALAALLAGDSSLPHARSTRVTWQDPPVHAATLLHYLAANGVEAHRQRSPANAEAIARCLLSAGAQADALAGMYGGDCTTLELLVSSMPPAKAGVQVPLVHALLDFGADAEGAGHSASRPPLLTALAFGFQGAARALVSRGARVDEVAKAAGLGDERGFRALLPGSSALDRHRALALAASGGHASIVRVLVESGEDPNRLNPPGYHAHSTPLHQAACAGHLGVVKALVALGARTGLRDTLWNGDALGWATHCNQPQVADYLRRLPGQ
jgi:hypothetical protein